MARSRTRDLAILFSKYMIDQIIPQLDIKAAGILFRALTLIQSIRVVSHDISPMACWINIKMAAKPVLPSRMTDQLQIPVRMHKEACSNLIPSTLARLKIIIRHHRQKRLPHFLK